MAAEPSDYYKLKREPVIVESRPDRVLVRFESFGPFGSFIGTVLYAQREGRWGCYSVKPNQSASIETAEAWLTKKDWFENDEEGDDEPTAPPAPRTRRKSRA